MAGIGFELRRLKRHDTHSGTLQAYTAFGVTPSGPWIISIIFIAILGTLLVRTLANQEQQLILSTLTYIYAFMLILTGAPSLVISRFVADAFSAKHPEKILPSYLGTLSITCVLAAFVSSLFFTLGVTASPFFKLAAIGLSMLVAASLITANYLGALKHYGSILAAFFCGDVLSCGLAYLFVCHHPWEPALALSGFVIGHLVLFTMLFASLHRQLPPCHHTIDFSCFRHFLRFPALALCGLFFHAGIWIDKLLCWWCSPSHTQVNGAIYAAPNYDVAVYLAVLSIVPGMAVFCFKLESEFAEHFLKYFKSLNGTGTFASLQARKERITVALRDGFILLMRVQAATTITLLIFTEEFTNFLHLGTLQLGVVRVTLLGAFFLVLFLSLLTTLFYFDDRRGSLISSGIFVTTNALVTGVSLLSGQAYHGTGFLLASCFAFAFTGIRVHQLLRDLEFRIFTTGHQDPVDALPAD